MQPMSFMLEGKGLFLGEALQGLRAVIDTGPHVLLVDQMDTVSGVLVAIEDKLGFLWYLPHTHSPIPAPSCHTALLVQGVQCSHSILVPEQCLLVGVLCYIPHPHKAVMGSAIEQGTSLDCQSLTLPR